LNLMQEFTSTGGDRHDHRNPVPLQSVGIYPAGWAGAWTPIGPAERRGLFG
jgi:hypothetical protein